MPRNRVGKFSLPPDLHPTQDLSPGGPPTKSLSPWARFGPPLLPAAGGLGGVTLPHPAKDLSPCAGSPSLPGGRRPGSDLPHPTQDLSPYGPPRRSAPRVGPPSRIRRKTCPPMGPTGIRPRPPTKSLSPWVRFGPPLPPAAGGLGGSPYPTQPKTCPPVRVPLPSRAAGGRGATYRTQPKTCPPVGFPGRRRPGWGLPPESDERPVPLWGPDQKPVPLGEVRSTPPPGGRRPGRVALPHPAKDLSPCAGSALPFPPNGRRLRNPTKRPVPLWRASRRSAPRVGPPSRIRRKACPPMGPPGIRPRPPTKSLSPWTRFGPRLPPAAGGLGGVTLPHPAKDLSPCGGLNGRRLRNPTKRPVPLWRASRKGVGGRVPCPRARRPEWVPSRER
jgi:hypothetical protein